MIETQIVSFTLGSERYGLTIASIKEILRVPTITSLPNTPDHFEGVVNIRGKLIPVIDLRIIMGMPALKLTEEARILNVEYSQGIAGLIVDKVHEVLRVSEEMIEAAPANPAAGEFNNNFIEGIVKLGDNLIILLNLEKVLN